MPPKFSISSLARAAPSGGGGGDPVTTPALTQSKLLPPPFTETCLRKVAPHVELIQRTDTATNDSVIFARKTVSDPDRGQREQEHYATRCRHPNVVKYVAGQILDDGRVVIDMEYCDAGQLDTVIHNFFSQTTLEHSIKNRIIAVKASARQALAGLAYYYEVHGRCSRDVKPQNLLVRSDGIIKVTDFDVSRCVVIETSSPSGRSQSITVRGTSGYMSPELQVYGCDGTGGRKIDPAKSDMWSFGVTCFQLLLQGELPFKRFGLGGFVPPSQRHVDQLPWELVSDPALEYLLRRCLCVEAVLRPTFCEALAITHIVSSHPDSDVWGDGFLSASGGGSMQQQQAVVTSAGVKLCDQVLQACVCAPDDASSIDEKVRVAGQAMAEELQGWKKVRSSSSSSSATPQEQQLQQQQREKQVDFAMKDIVNTRNQKAKTAMKAFV